METSFANAGQVSFGYCSPWAAPGTIGVVVGDIENVFFSLAVRGISDAAKNASFNGIIANSGEVLEAEKAAIDLLIGRRVAGLIVTPADHGQHEHLSAALDVGVPLVLFDREVPDLSVDAVTGADRESAIEATLHLQQHGHRNIAHVTAREAKIGDHWTPQTHLTAHSVVRRIEGFMSVQSQTGLLTLNASCGSAQLTRNTPTR